MCEFVNNTQHSRIDRCMKPLIAFLRKEGYKTVACCCGHGRYRMTVVHELRNGDRIELFSGVEIPRKRRLYVKDTAGRYFLPEVEPMKR